MDSDDEITLSSSAMDALKSFYAERDENQRRFAELNAAATAAAAGGADAETAAKPAEPLATADKPLSMKMFSEDWNASQFWYTDETASLFARQLLAGAGDDTVIAVVSTPSVFVALKNEVAKTGQKSRLVLLEYDSRFGVFPEFVQYDFNAPIKLPAELRGCADRIIVDPPFLSEDCQTKMALTVRWLSRTAESRVLVCTGERMAPLVTGKLYKAQGVRATDLEIQQGLSNEFLCYTNYETDAWKFVALKD